MKRQSSTLHERQYSSKQFLGDVSSTQLLLNDASHLPEIRSATQTPKNRVSGTDLFRNLER